MASPSGSPQPRGWFRFRYEEDRESPADARNVLLMWRSYSSSEFSGRRQPSWWHLAGQPRWSREQTMGSAIYADQKQVFYVFLIAANALALSTLLTYGLPFYFEVWVATSFMFATYASAIFCHCA
ncbi:unnamed protein product [Fraxinus pennsylvanica]|uniref:Uncharacterized protein n=1 Tax=Fraxinus pennsylvanica TaxID=56036 RepID=A0AAD2DZB3_9LAMI|nr:unnamed protein product [Fraxinus pennsylvanica]